MKHAPQFNTTAQVEIWMCCWRKALASKYTPENDPSRNAYCDDYLNAQAVFATVRNASPQSGQKTVLYENLHRSLCAPLYHWYGIKMFSFSHANHFFCLFGIVNKMQIMKEKMGSSCSTARECEKRKCVFLVLLNRNKSKYILYLYCGCECFFFRLSSKWTMARLSLSTSWAVRLYDGRNTADNQSAECYW